MGLQSAAVKTGCFDARETDACSLAAKELLNRSCP